MDDKFQEQYVLRVKRGSEIDLALRALEEGPLSKEDIQEISGYSRTASRLRAFAQWFDNIKVAYRRGDDEKLHELMYTNVMPSNIQVVTSDVNVSGSIEGAAAPAGSGELEAKELWPMAPPYIEVMDNFDSPSWFEEMRAMVKLGAHISLEGPPSVGKDTAVEQLAAQEGKPLVTIGGDAGFRTRDLTGGDKVVNGTSFHAVGEYVAAAVNGWWVLLTEVNAADPSALMYINRQLAPPYVVNFGGKAYPVHPDFRLFITYNHGLVGTKPLPQSFKDRFFPIKMSFFTHHQLKRRLQAMGLPKEDPPTNDTPYVELAWQEKLVRFGIRLWDAHESGKIRYQVTTRRLKDAFRLKEALGCSIEDAIQSAVISAIDSPLEAKAARTVLQQGN